MSSAHTHTHITELFTQQSCREHAVIFRRSIVISGATVKQDFLWWYSQLHQGTFN